MEPTKNTNGKAAGARPQTLLLGPNGKPLSLSPNSDQAATGETKGIFLAFDPAKGILVGPDGKPISAPPPEKTKPAPAPTPPPRPSVKPLAPTPAAKRQPLSPPVEQSPTFREKREAFFDGLFDGESWSGFGAVILFAIGAVIAYAANPWLGHVFTAGAVIGAMLLAAPSFHLRWMEGGNPGFGAAVSAVLVGLIGQAAASNGFNFATLGAVALAALAASALAWRATARLPKNGKVAVYVLLFAAFTAGYLRYAADLDIDHNHRLSPAHKWRIANQVDDLLAKGEPARAIALAEELKDDEATRAAATGAVRDLRRRIHELAKRDAFGEAEALATVSLPWVKNNLSRIEKSEADLTRLWVKATLLQSADQKVRAQAKEL